MSCSRAEIERKRLAAIQKRQSNGLSKTESVPTSNKSTVTGAIKTIKNINSFHPYARNEAQEKTEHAISNCLKLVTGTIYLISEERFEVNPSAYSVPLINIFKSIPSRLYDAKTKMWNFSINDYQELVSKVTPLAPHVVLGTIPACVLKVLTEPSIDPDSVDLSPIEATLRNKLLPFQEDGVRFAIAKKGRCMNADDMGLGKTFQALAIASYYKHNWPLLIVTTSSMRDIWQFKIHELLPSTPMMNIVTLTSSKDGLMVADRQTEVVIVSYKITTMHTQLLKAKKFGVVIIDESHYLKSHKAQCTIALTSITKSASRVILLSGTPALSRPAELYTQLNIIEPHFFNSFTEYGKRYCAGKLTNFGWDMNGQSNLVELQILLHRKFLIRRTKEQVLTQLHGKTRESVMLDPTLLQTSMKDKENLTQMAQNYVKKKSSEKHAALLTFFSESAQVKIPAVCQYLTQQLQDHPTVKFLIFAHHKIMVEAVCLMLDELQIHYICIVGSTPPASRADLVDKFQYSEICRCAVLSITAASAGITLTAAKLVIFAELHWNPGILVQAESRAHRIGQGGVVQVRYLLAAGTSDDYMWPLLQDKLNVLNEVGLSKDTFEDATLRIQESKNSITQYLQSPSSSKNANDYIPGTNIRKNSTQDQTINGECRIKQNCTMIEDSFLDDDEGDKLLADLDL